MNPSNVNLEFSKYAKHYEQRNVIQNMVVDELFSHLTTQPKNILDLGCGSGAIYKKINWKYEQFIGVDFAKGMLDLHPKASNVSLIYGDFNTQELFDTLQSYSFDHIFSASALQWATNLENVFMHLQKFNAPISLAIFTSHTFHTLHQTASISSLLRSAKEIEILQKKYFQEATFEIKKYQLPFDTTREMLRYIKQSGVSGSRKLLSLKQTKKLLDEYPLSYLEFEVAFIYTKG
ncbi:putative methyl transferase [hydrothermal vent metagenome]|uniref:Putative methyl transferase n=1 Tax=hydrothermal vent metagenome TaxID=652676 RepID=A0A1W1D1M4_9ZZZZ